MKRLNLDEIKKNESPPKIVNIFSEKEIKMIQELYLILPEKTFNKKQNVRKKAWIQNYNKDLDKIYLEKLKDALGDFKMDSLKSEVGEDFYGLYHESFSPLPLHVDSGFDENNIIYKQVVTPLTPYGQTVVFKNKWYGRSTSFTINDEELKFKPQPGQNERSSEHLKEEPFDKKIHQQYLTHIDINNLRGLKVETIYEWKIGETLIMDRSHIHSASSNIKDRKLGLTTFTKK